LLWFVLIYISKFESVNLRFLLARFLLAHAGCPAVRLTEVEGEVDGLCFCDGGVDGKVDCEADVPSRYPSRCLLRFIADE